MSRSLPEIIEVLRRRQNTQGLLLAKMREISRRYNGEWVMPLPSLESEDVIAPLIPALIAESIDMMAMRAASVLPYIGCPALDPKSTRSLDYADTRRRALAATWQRNDMKLKRRRYFRHYNGYATYSMSVLPDHYEYEPRVILRDPLSSYPDPRAPEDTRPPLDIIYAFEQSSSYLRLNFPQCREENGGPIRPTGRPDVEMWETLEYFDADECVIAISGPSNPDYRSVSNVPGRTMECELVRYPNRLGRCPAIMPQAITMDKIAAKVASTTGIVDLMAKLTALEVIAQEKAIFPDLYMIGRPGGLPRVVGGTWEDGRTGKPNILADVDRVDQIRSDVGQMTSQIIDRLERAMRTSTGMVAQYSGETSGALRTGRGMDSLMSAAVDPRIQELHEVDEAHSQHLNALLIDTYKAYWPGKTYVMFSGWAGDRGQVEFTPSKHFETSHTVVNYAIPGADVLQTTTSLGQLYGMKGISLHTLRNRHPWIDDALAEKQMVELEELEESVKTAMERQVATGQLPLVYAAKVYRFRKDGMSMFEALEEADKEARAEQATPAPEAPEGMAAPPASMPGLAGGPQGVVQGPQGMPPGLPTEAPGQLAGNMPPTGVEPGNMAGGAQGALMMKRLMMAMNQKSPAA